MSGYLSTDQFKVLSFFRNIVNGLRDDDGDSFYGDRSSFVSEYSRRDSVGDGLRLFFKGHEKKGSKGSNASTSTRKRPYPKPSARPETKVRLIRPIAVLLSVLTSP